jgi:hypothetical protein
MASMARGDDDRRQHQCGQLKSEMGAVVLADDCRISSVISSA